MNLAATFVPSSQVSPHQFQVFVLQIGVLLLLATMLGRLAVKVNLPAVVPQTATVPIISSVSMTGKILI